ncbi:hypothetical protein BJ170DRAFT_678402 [Xylariales sp. AK1849]|nr:hypothetical protein BJ170DRAFT_678402 [Xylariales sp. AK1849]
MGTGSRWPPPPAPGSRHGYGSERADDAQSYRPSYRSYAPPPAVSPPFRGGGTSRADSDRYVPGQQGDHSRSYPDTRRQDGHDYAARNDHNYRPPQGDFTFRAERPPGVEENTYESYRHPPPSFRGNRGPDRRGALDQSDSYRPRNENNRPGRASGPRHNQGRRVGPYQRGAPKAADRPFLYRKHDQDAQVLLGDTTGKATYRAVEDSSDSDDAAMEISDESGTESNEPANKRARLAVTTSNTDQAMPKWSNPDPYTVLPPTDETQRKKKDVVQLIRKARVEADLQKPSVSTEAADFISCDFSDDDSGRGKPKSLHSNSGQPLGVPDVPTGPRAGVSAVSAPQTATSTLPPRPPISLSIPQKQLQKQNVKANDQSRISTQPQSSSTAATNNKKSKVPANLVPSGNLGSRKRTIDDKIKRPHQKLKRASKMKGDGYVDSNWEVISDEDPCPWTETDHAIEPNMAIRLHKELVDFHEYVRPRDFEDRVRHEMVDKLEALVKRKWPTARILPFGSFKSGLYLPTADMDLVMCSQGFLNGGRPGFNTTSHLFTLRAHLTRNHVAFLKDIEVVPKAKVPLLKYCDEGTGLKVDISFENLTGITAIQTFLDWKDRYPAMPKLVAIIKHFLCMRGLNEPVNGGIGGFSVICLVVHLLHSRPEIQSGTMLPDHHLGELLLEFFKMYGEDFDYRTTAISMKPPRFVGKNEVSNVVYRNWDRLSIIDPNNPENDISGGSSNFHLVCQNFKLAYMTLKQRMHELATSESKIHGYNTILAPLFAGNYSSFREQRDYMRKLADKGVPELEDTRSAEDRIDWNA